MEKDKNISIETEKSNNDLDKDIKEVLSEMGLDNTEEKIKPDMGSVAVGLLVLSVTFADLSIFIGWAGIVFLCGN